MSFGVETEFFHPSRHGMPEEAEELLLSQGLRPEGAPDVTVVLRMGSRPAATASLEGDVIKMVAVAEEFQEMGLAAQAVSRVIEWARSKGLGHLFIYTKPTEADKFVSLGFTEIARSHGAVLLEMGRPNVEDFGGSLRALREALGVTESGAVVMNANPFTLGHRYLAKTASAMSEHLFVVVVRADRSSFPFEDRFEMVKLGVADLSNVTVLDSGPYAVSSATFPTYFLRDPSMEDLIGVQTRLDSDLFGRLFVPSLGVKRRFVGTEPYCPVTAAYNRAMREVLPRYGVEVVEVPRLEVSGRPVSASEVRSAMAEGRLEDLRGLLPDSTLNYLFSERGRYLFERVAASKGGH
ncbi:(citrate (pro-3S)-lyase) ligase [Thermanaerovibrio velox DSM 12556]|uniref:(Citrate (Pro-3S)-lyase) ligase n=1 Tax=Thermanaerovibrio velox DSM 12556 TaxID=926567 RepID=H0UND0_9BACT|nr:[citrate (pro-3S)-lyase] ligase [Thermanaerovibrio velox]EHM09337.1 (citrate (pro-3S)-lyase) ligase [Thermanaerovibrio velox DSM 12556]